MELLAVLLTSVLAGAFGATIPLPSTTNIPQDPLPGFRTRITQKGFDYASSVAVDLLMRELSREDQVIPDVSGSIGTAKVTIKNIKVMHFERPETGVYSVENIGLRWRVSGLTFNMSADYRARFGFGFFSIRKRGSVQVDVEDFAYNADFVIGRDETGRPRVSRVVCSAAAENIDISFTGDWSDMLNMGASVFKYRIEDALEEQVCSRAREELTGQLDYELSTLPLKVQVDNDYEIDFRLTRPPVFADGYIETDHKGDIELKGDGSQPDFEPAPIPAYTEHTDKMVYLYATDFMINSGLDAAYRNNKLKIDVSAEKLPPDAREFFSPTCGSLMCLNTIFSQITEMYPHGEPFLTVKAAKAPIVYNDGQKHQIRGVGHIDVSMVQDGEKHFVFTLETTAVLEFDIQVSGNRLMFNITDVEHDTEMVNSTVGNVLTGFLFETAIGIAIEDMALPELRKVGWEGIPLPEMEHVQFVNSVIIDHEADGVMVVGTDIDVRSLPQLGFMEEEDPEYTDVETY